jgi:gephyrin
MMSRPVAGVRNKSIIITVPGSPRGAKENLESVIKLLPHACTQAADLRSSRDLHSGGLKKLEREHGVDKHFPKKSEEEKGVCCHHNHHYHHHGEGHRVPRPHTTPEQRANRLGDSVTRRHRESPYPMISVTDANSIISKETELAPVVEVPVNEALVGYVLSKAVTAPEAVPAFRASIVDGYAVHHSDGPGTYPVVSVSHASPSRVLPLQPGQIARITTGAPLPPGATAVVMVEDTILRTTTDDDREEEIVEILASNLEPGENVREVGSDVPLHSVILEKGTTITPTGGEIGLLASVGISTVSVYAKPIVGVLSTGDEVVPHNRLGELEFGEIRDSNRPTLLSAIKSYGFPAKDLGIAADQPGALADVLKAALESVDVVITTGGVSMGELDLLKPTIEQSIAGTLHFGRVAMKPGKPTTFATACINKDKKRLIFALPGNPASALVTFHLFVLPSLRKAAGYVPYALPVVRVVASHDFPLDPRPEYHRVQISMRKDGRLAAKSTGGQRSSRIGSSSAANGVLVLPARKKSVLGEKRADFGMLPKGEVAEAILWAQISGAML